MTLTEQLHGDALENIRQAKRAMEKLSQVTADHQARIVLECEFRSIEETIQEFGESQFGLKRTRM